jgi:hypothetical protein
VKKQRKLKQGASGSRTAVSELRHRDVGDTTRILLFSLAGGRCEFDGCGRYLLEHHLTKARGNFAAVAHICAFSEKGPRAEKAMNAKSVNALPNLMLLCPDCHKLVDDAPKIFTVDVLRGQKRAHEDRIYMLTATRPDRHTVAVALTASVANRKVSVSTEEIQQAVAPRYVGERDIVRIDLNTVPEEPTDHYWSTARKMIEREASRLHSGVFEGGPARHVSVFAIAPIPLLVFFGRLISDKVPSTLYQRHRSSQDWLWKDQGPVVDFETRQVQVGSDPARVALVMSLSGRIPRSDYASHVDSSFSVYEMSPKGREPGLQLLEREDSLRACQAVFLGSLRSIVANHPTATQIHLFPAIPAPVAVMVGRDLLPKRDPTVVLYDFNKAAGGFVRAFEVNQP